MVFGRDTLGTGIDIEATLAKEADECEPGSLGELDGEAGWGRHRCDDRNAGSVRFLNNLESGASGDHQHSVRERQAPAQQGRPDDFVRGVVPSDVFPEIRELAGRREEGRCVKASVRAKIDWLSRSRSGRA